MASEPLADGLFLALFDAFPAAVLLVDDDVRIVRANVVATALLGPGAEKIMHRRGGEALQCLNAQAAPDGCGHADGCRGCVIRSSVGRAFAGERVVRARTKMNLVGSKGTRRAFFLVTASALQFEGTTYCVLVLEDFSELVAVRSLLPICSYCKKVRNDADYWEQVESYLNDHLDLAFSHGICPECLEIQLAELWLNKTRGDKDG